MCSYDRTAVDVEKAVRHSGAIPATVAVLNGKLCVGEFLALCSVVCGSAGWELISNGK